MKVKTRKYTEGGITWDLPTYMWPHRKQIAKFFFEKLLERLIAKKARGGA